MAKNKKVTKKAVKKNNYTNIKRGQYVRGGKVTHDNIGLNIQDKNHVVYRKKAQRHRETSEAKKRNKK